MSYYSERRKAIILIDNLYDKGLTKEAIIYRIEKDFGFTKKIVEGRLKLIEDIEMSSIKAEGEKN